MRTDFLELKPNVNGSGAVITGAGPELRTRDYEAPTVHVVGTYTGSVDIEATLDGSTWFKLQTGITAGGLYQWAAHAFFAMRINITSLSSGAPTAHFGGLNTRCDP